MHRLPSRATSIGSTTPAAAASHPHTRFAALLDAFGTGRGSSHPVVRMTGEPPLARPGPSSTVVGGSPASPERWDGRPAPEEDEVLARAVAPVLDVAAGLAAMSWPWLGPATWRSGSTSPLRTRARPVPGARYEMLRLRRVPGAGRWATVLLFDGNIGIGGDPAASLRRIAALLRPAGGGLLTELSRPGPWGPRAGPPRGRRPGRIRVPLGPGRRGRRPRRRRPRRHGGRRCVVRSWTLVRPTGRRG